MLGIGTVSVKVSGPANFKVDDPEIKGTVTITGKSDQVIESITVNLKKTGQPAAVTTRRRKNSRSARKNILVLRSRPVK
jgi:hypothetical protein